MHVGRHPILEVDQINLLHDTNFLFPSGHVVLKRYRIAKRYSNTRRTEIDFQTLPAAIGK